MKFTLIGAGSFGFTRNLVRDILSFPALAGCTLALTDINEENLEVARIAVERIAAAGQYPTTVTATTDRGRALDGADAVIVTIRVGGLEQIRADYETPFRYGISINIGDTRGPAGVFRFLRTAPVLLDICRDMERHCPSAILLNYTNPMPMLCSAMARSSRLTVVGLCHSVQGTAAMLARWLGAQSGEVSYRCAGINHQAWFLRFLLRGTDAYPLLREAVARPEIYDEERVRNEMFLHLGYYVTESSGHNSEYNPWFRKRPDLLEKYCLHGTSSNPGRELIRELIVKFYTPEEQRRRREEMLEWTRQPIDLARGVEYAASLLNAVLGDGAPFEFNGNVPNDGLIDNLPPGSCVEVPILASRAGIQPVRVGRLPAQLAALNDTNARCDDMAVAGFLGEDPTAILHAITYDPLTAAVLSLEEIRSMVREMFAAASPWLPKFSAAAQPSAPHARG